MHILISILFACLAGCLAGCASNSQSGPQSISETSTVRPKLQDRINFIEQYVTFKRNYLKLEYEVQYHNNSSGIVPGPSDWDIKILAVVPPSEIAAWFPSNQSSISKQPPAWLTAMPGTISRAKVTEWYATGGTEVGVDRNTSTIAYRNSTFAGTPQN
jgi:hypothetical protein